MRTYFAYGSILSNQGHTHTPPHMFMASIGDTIILHMFTHHANGNTQLTCDDLSWPQLTCKLSESSDFLQGN